jgi:hypothetical protein
MLDKVDIVLQAPVRSEVMLQGSDSAHRATMRSKRDKSTAEIVDSEAKRNRL